MRGPGARYAGRRNPNRISSGVYAAVTNEVQRAGYVAAANYASAVLASPIEVFYVIVDLSIGISSSVS
jgi:hypothetical protein